MLHQILRKDVVDVEIDLRYMIFASIDPNDPMARQGSEGTHMHLHVLEAGGSSPNRKGILMCTLFPAALIVAFCGLALGELEATETLNISPALSGSLIEAEELELSLKWSRDLSSQEYLVGSVDYMVGTTEGLLLCLDRQLSTVHVFDPTGEYVQSIGREGDGPGETRNPNGLCLVSPEVIALSQSYPGKITQISFDGSLVDETIPRLRDAGEGGFITLQASRITDSGTFVAGWVGGMEGTVAVTDFLIGRLGEKDQIVTRFFQHTLHNDLLSSRTCREGDEYYRKMLLDLWDVNSHGRVFLVPNRNEYFVRLPDSDGSEVCSIRRSVSTCPRPAELLRSLEARYKAYYKSLPFDVSVELHNDEPAIHRLEIHPDGNLAVLPCAGMRSTGPRMTLHYDIYSRNGTYLKTIVVECLGDPYTDRLFFLPGETVVCVRNFSDPKHRSLRESVEYERKPPSAGVTLDYYEVEVRQ